jgi:hypothetical protein
MRASAGVSADGSTDGGSGTVGTSGSAGTRWGSARAVCSPIGVSPGSPVDRPDDPVYAEGAAYPAGGADTAGAADSYGSRRGKLSGSYDGRTRVVSAEPPG